MHQAQNKDWRMEPLLATVSSVVAQMGAQYHFLVCWYWLTRKLWSITMGDHPDEWLLYLYVLSLSWSAALAMCTKQSRFGTLRLNFLSISLTLKYCIASRYLIVDITFYRTSLCLMVGTTELIHINNDKRSLQSQRLTLNVTETIITGLKCTQTINSKCNLIRLSCKSRIINR